MDNLKSFYDDNLKKANLEAICHTGDHKFHAVDICDLELLSQIMALHRPAVVIHPAACVGVRPSIRQSHLYEQVNIAGTLNLLELCRQFHVEKLIFGSSRPYMGPGAEDNDASQIAHRAI